MEFTRGTSAAEHALESSCNCGSPTPISCSQQLRYGNLFRTNGRGNSSQDKGHPCTILRERGTPKAQRTAVEGVDHTKPGILKHIITLQEY
jgi:hypothetical protein